MADHQIDKSKKNYSILNLGNEITLKDFLYALIPMVETFSLVIRDYPFNKKQEEFLLKLSLYEVSRVLTKEWPGTRLLGKNSAYLFNYKFCQSSIDILNCFVKDLFELYEQNLPEDICLYREDSTPLFISISHEKDAFISVDEEEFKFIEWKIPRLKVESYL